MGGTDAGRISTAAQRLGGSGGEERHTLTRAELPTEVLANNSAGSTAGGGSAWLAANVFGGGGSHNIMQPFHNTNMIIRVA